MVLPRYCFSGACSLPNFTEYCPAAAAVTSNLPLLLKDSSLLRPSPTGRILVWDTLQPKNDTWEHFYCQFTLKWNTFNRLFKEKIQRYLQREDKRFRFKEKIQDSHCVTPEKVLVIEIYRFTHGGSFENTGVAMNAGKTAAIEPFFFFRMEAARERKTGKSLFVHDRCHHFSPFWRAFEKIAADHFMCQEWIFECLWIPCVMNKQKREINLAGQKIGRTTLVHPRCWQTFWQSKQKIGLPDPLWSKKVYSSGHMQQFYKRAMPPGYGQRSSYNFIWISTWKS